MTLSWLELLFMRLIVQPIYYMINVESYGRIIFLELKAF